MSATLNEFLQAVRYIEKAVIQKFYSVKEAKEPSWMKQDSL